jgi:solute carrier family 25 (adenine nucleotide translocator) protein 4/5/6/31
LDGISVGMSFCIGYGVTVVSGITSYPIDTIRRRMMMTSGEGIKYKGSFDCATKILKNEGVKFVSGLTVRNRMSDHYQITFK